MEEKKKRKLFKGYSAMEKIHFPFIAVMLILPIANIIVFWFVPNIASFATAFTDRKGDFSFESIIFVAQSFFNGMDQWGYNPGRMLLNSMAIWANLNIICLVVATFMSFLLTKHMILSKTFRIVYMLPSLVGGVVFSSVMKGMYAYDGPILAIAKSLEIDLPMAIRKNGLLGHESTAFKTMYLQMFLQSATGGSMIMAGAYMRIPKEIFESSELEGCGFFREAFQIAIPCVWPTLSTLIVFSLCTFFTADWSFYLYSNGTGAHGLTSIGYYLYQFRVMASGTTDTQYLVGYTSALGMFLTLITVPLVVAGRKLLEKIGDNVEF